MDSLVVVAAQYLLVGAGAVVMSAARVLAHVHHVQDVAAGLALGLVAGAAAILVVRVPVVRVLAGRQLPSVVPRPASEPADVPAPRAAAPSGPRG